MPPRSTKAPVAVSEIGREIIAAIKENGSYAPLHKIITRVAGGPQFATATSRVMRELDVLVRDGLLKRDSPEQYFYELSPEAKARFSSS